MENDLSKLAETLGAMISGKGKREMLENMVRLLSSENGRRVVSALMSDGGEQIKLAAESAKNGDFGGIEQMISTVAKTPGGAELLSSLANDLKE